MTGLLAVGNSFTVSIGRLEASNRRLEASNRIIGEIQEAKAGSNSQARKQVSRVGLVVISRRIEDRRSRLVCSRARTRIIR